MMAERTLQASISLSFFSAYNQNFITPFQGARCVHGFSVGVARPFAFLGKGDKEWIK